MRKNNSKNKKNDKRNVRNDRNDRNDRRKDFVEKPFRRNSGDKLSIEEDAYRLEGRNPILEALNTGRTIDKIFVKNPTMSFSHIVCYIFCLSFWVRF